MLIFFCTNLLYLANVRPDLYLMTETSDISNEQPEVNAPLMCCNRA